MNLVDSNEAFFYVDQSMDGVWFRIFNYRLASYTDFLNPDALECRGHTFQISQEGSSAIPVRVASWCFNKFFNLYENPFTMDLDLSTIDEIAVKEDGSMISSYMIKDQLYLKTKGSLHSDQAVAAMEWINRPENVEFKKEIVGAERLGYTVIMEYVAPDNRIVLGYENKDLRVLGIRSNIDGSYVPYNDIDLDVFPEIAQRWTSHVDVDKVSMTKEEFIASVPDMKEDIEGFVVTLSSGLRFKVKTKKYLALHHTKDSINSPRRLFEAVLEEATDDMRSLFHDDKIAIKTIEDMELFVDKEYNHMVNSVERFYETNKHLERKDYAILGQQELPRMYFGLAMSKFIGKEVDYKSFMKKNWKNYGIKDKDEKLE